MCVQLEVGTHGIEKCLHTSGGEEGSLLTLGKYESEAESRRIIHLR